MFNRTRFSLLAGLLLIAAPAVAQDRYAIDEATNLAGQLRMLTQRAAKQYLMYQYRVGELARGKQPLLDTVDRFNRTLADLRVRRRSDAGAKDAQAIREVTADIERRWEVLEAIFSYQPHERWRERSLLPQQIRREDPVAVKYVDRLSRELLERTERLAELYNQRCEAAGLNGCEGLIADTGELRMLTEAMAKDTHLSSPKAGR